MRRVVLLALALGLQAGAAAAQEMRPFSTFRQLHGETRLHASLEYAAGALRLAPAVPPSSTGWTCCTTGSAIAPVSDYDAARSAVSLGLRAAGNGGAAGGVARASSGRRPSSPSRRSSELDLAVDLGAVDGGPRARRSAPHRRSTWRPAPAGRRSGSPSRTPRAAATAVLSSGAAELTVLGLGNSRCDRDRVRGRRGPGDAGLRRRVDLELAA